MYINKMIYSIYMDAKIKKQHFGYSVEIGDYFIRIYETTANLQNIHGNYDNFSEVLQYCKDKFPSLKTLEFTDDSKINVIIKPRDQHTEKPFFLAHFFIAKYGKTWFEDKFGAKMKDVEAYLRYREATEILQKPIGISFHDFICKAQCTDEQSFILKNYFDPAMSWHDFFNKIPEKIQYFSCFGWLDSFIQRLLKNTYSMHNWYIDFI
jgi:hypothetical protein